VFREIGSSAILDTGAAFEVDINLDVVANKSEDILGQIYNKVCARFEYLSRPLQ
jgi:hypothetical protein